jgi:hypothetical protein
VIEHIGVAETGVPKYSVRPLPDRDDQRAAFLAELFRVTRAGGVVFLDCPNGAFPIFLAWRSARSRETAFSPGRIPSHRG